MKRAVVVYSGGLDSTVLIYHLLDMGYTVLPLTLNYGQRHTKEFESSRYFTKKLGLSHQEIDLEHLRDVWGSNTLTDADTELETGIPEDYARAKSLVPNRNMVLCSIAASWAMSMGFNGVAYGCHSHAYPDCTPTFAKKLERALQLSCGAGFELITPFAEETKADIVKRGTALSVPFEKTWTCYDNGEVHCGSCAACVGRKMAFETAHIPDPTEYAQKEVLTAL